MLLAQLGDANKAIWFIILCYAAPTGPVALKSLAQLTDLHLLDIAKIQEGLDCKRATIVNWNNNPGQNTRSTQGSEEETKRKAEWMSR